MSRHLALIATLFTLMFWASDAYAGCTKDTDCKGDRICEKGSCVSPASTAPAAPAKGSIKAKCDHKDCYVTFIRADRMNNFSDGSMQMLIGFVAGESWAQASDMTALLGPSASKSDGAHRATPYRYVELPAGMYMAVAGLAGRFDGSYHSNGAIKPVEVKANQVANVEFHKGDFNHTFYCISCPHLYAFDGLTWTRIGEVIRNRMNNEGRDEAEFDLTVVDGFVQLQLREELDEVSHLDHVVLQINGQIYTAENVPSLSARDGDRSVMKIGDVIDLRFKVPAELGNRVHATVISSGWYEPSADSKSNGLLVAR